MESRWRALAVAAVLLGGCAREGAAPSPPAGNPSTVSSQRDFQSPSQTAAEKPAAKAEKRPAAQQAASADVDAFGLPLVIVIEAPEAPKEIQGPSPPIPDEPKNAEKR
jgi:hypothetical protein